MSQQVKVERSIQLIGNASHAQNIEGPMKEKMVHFQDHFLVDTLNGDNYTSTNAGVGAGIAISANIGGMVRLTAGTTDGNAAFLATDLNWEADKNMIAEARIRIVDVSVTALFFGFSDATSETTPAMPIDIDGDTETAAADNAVGIVCDADSTTLGVSSIVGMGVAATTKDTTIDSGTDWADNEWHILRVEVTKGTTNGSAVFYLDGSPFGYMDNAILTTTDCCVMVAAANRSGTNVYVDVDRIDAWQDES